MTVKATEFRTRTGRIVWTGSDSNSLYDPVTTDFDGAPLKPNDDGSPGVIYRLGLAIAKQPGETHWATSPEGAVIWAQGHRDHPQAATGSDFSWKVVDGDSTVKTAKAKTRPCDKEGFPGHWVYTFSSGFPFKFVNADGSAYLLDRGTVKVGDYVQIAGTTAGNTGKSPGVYINHRFVSLQYIGVAIVSGPDPKTLGFGQGPAPANMQLGVAPPPSSTPATPSNSTPPPPGGSAPPPPPPAQQQQQVPQVPVSPAPGFVGAPPLPNGAPPAPGAAPPPPPPQQAPAGPQMTALAKGQPYAAFIAAGWTDAALKANGYMA